MRDCRSNCCRDAYGYIGEIVRTIVREELRNCVIDFSTTQDVTLDPVPVQVAVRDVIREELERALQKFRL